MALTGNTVQSTYLDLVQLEKSGAGLPSHAGKEAALYDGSGAQILGRTAVRHWLDPDPDAISGSFEFSTMGAMNQTALETAGWTFTNCTGSVSNGVFWLEAPTSTAIAGAYRTVSLAGDFDILVSFCFGDQYGNIFPVAYYGGAMYVGVNGDVAHGVKIGNVNGRARAVSLTGGTWAGLAGSATNNEIYASPTVHRMNRVGGTLYIAHSQPFPGPSLKEDETGHGDYGWGGVSVADGSTFDRIGFFMGSGNVSAGSTKRVGLLFLRRFQ